MQDNCQIHNIKALTTVATVYALSIFAGYLLTLAVASLAAFAAAITSAVTLGAVFLHLVVYPTLAVATFLTFINHIWDIPKIPRLIVKGIRGIAWSLTRIAYLISTPRTKEGLIRAAAAGNGFCTQDHKHWILPWAFRSHGNDIIKKRLTAKGVYIDSELSYQLAQPVKVMELNQ